MASRTQVRTDVKDALVNANIQLNGNSVPIRASYSDEDVTQADAPFIVVNPVEKGNLRNRFGSDYEEETLPIQIYVFAANSFALDEVTEDVEASIPSQADDARLDEIESSYAFSPAQDVKMHSMTISALYERK